MVLFRTQELAPAVRYHSFLVSVSIYHKTCNICGLVVILRYIALFGAIYCNILNILGNMQYLRYAIFRGFGGSWLGTCCEGENELGGELNRAAKNQRHNTASHGSNCGQQLKHDRLKCEIVVKYIMIWSMFDVVPFAGRLQTEWGSRSLQSHEGLREGE